VKVQQSDNQGRATRWDQEKRPTEASTQPQSASDPSAIDKL
jgi:hypothetical protein